MMYAPGQLLEDASAKEGAAYQMQKHIKIECHGVKGYGEAAGVWQLALNLP